MSTASSPKGIILAGGTGSRLHPLTRITNKHLLPIWDRPMISYAVQAMVTSGIEEIMLVTGGTHAGEFLRLLGNGQDHGVARLSYAYQEKAGGIAEALGLAARFAGGSPVVVMLADNIFEHSIAPAVARFAAQPAGARVLLARIDDEAHLRHLGVAEMDSGNRITRIVEKPVTPPTPYAVTGVYCYDSTVFDVIPTLVPSARGELEITDVNNYYVQRGTLEHDVIDGFWGDAGGNRSAPTTTSTTSSARTAPTSTPSRTNAAPGGRLPPGSKTPDRNRIAPYHEPHERTSGRRS